MENSRICEICDVSVHRASYAKHLRTKKDLKNEKQKGMFLPEWLFKDEQAPIKKQKEKVYNPKTLKQIAKEIIRLDVKKLDEELAEKINIP